MEERLQKIISAAGVTSRRAAEELIREGRVRVNGKVVTELGSKADAAKDHIKVDGKLINPRQPMTHIMLNKPAGYVTTMADPEGRPTVLELLKGLKIRVYPVGRLDYNTEGLLLLTNDGDFAHLITHPKHELPKTYRAKVKGVLEDRQIAQLEEGIYLDDGRTAPARVKKLSKEEVNSWLEITIHEGRKRQVRRMFDRVGHSVIKLKRVKVGTLALGDLEEGSFRHLTIEEVADLKALAFKEEGRPLIARSTPREAPRSADHRSAAGRKPEPGRRPAMKARPGAGRAFEARTAPKQEGAERKPGKSAPGRGPRRSLRGTASEGAKAAPGRRLVETRTGPKQEGAVRKPGKGALGRGPRHSFRGSAAEGAKTGAERRTPAGSVGASAGNRRPGSQGGYKPAHRRGPAPAGQGRPHGRKNDNRRR